LKKDEVKNNFEEKIDVAEEEKDKDEDEAESKAQKGSKKHGKKEER
jgi:hypothetical protein